MIDPEVLDATMPFLKDCYGNAGSIHGLGADAKRAVEEAREQVRKFFGADSPENIIFTSGGTEANSAAMRSAVCKYTPRKYKTVAISAGEHDSVVLAGKFWGREHNYNLETIPIGENGIISARSMIDYTTKNVDVIAAMYVNNEVGSINKVKMIGEVCRTAKIRFHCDCVQAAGCVPIKVNEMQCDTASISAHKIHGMKGVGALYLKTPYYFNPMIRGGGNQEFGKRGGTENVAGIVSLGKACEIIMRDGELGKRVTELKKLFWNTLLERAKLDGTIDRLHDNVGSSELRGKVLSIRFDGVDAETLVIMAASKGVCISAGSACKSHEQKPNEVPLAVGLNPTQARETVRISFSKFNTEEEVVEAANIISDIVVDLLNYSECSLTSDDTQIETM
jgi:cysteine desulfurase